MKRSIILSICILLLCGSMVSQELYQAQMNNDYFNVDREVNSVMKPTKQVHSAMRGYFIPELKRSFNYDSIVDSYEWKRTYKKKVDNLFWNAAFNKHWIFFNSKNFSFHIDPLFDFGFGYDVMDSSTSWTNKRGILAEGTIAKKLSFSFRVYEVQEQPVGYINDWIKEHSTAGKHIPVIPGGTVAKRFKGSVGQYDYTMASGYISYSPCEEVNLQLGSGKFFLGDGYRSLLLSDNGPNMPYAAININAWRFKYQMIWSQLYDYSTVPLVKNIYNKKWMATHYLSFIASKRIQIGLFESIVWADRTADGYRGFDFAYLNPIIFFRAVEYGLGNSTDNVLIGLNFSYKISKNYVAYAQFMLDEFKLGEMMKGNGWWANKWGVQVGAKVFDFCKVKNLYFQAEFNAVRPYTYAHYSGLTNYAGSNMSITHPLEANFYEAIFIAKYNYKRWYFRLQADWAKYGLDIDPQTGLAVNPENNRPYNYGHDIFYPYDTRVSDYGNKIGQGLTTQLLYGDISASWLMNPAMNMNITAGCQLRRETNALWSRNTAYFYLAFRTSLDKFYKDF